MKQTTIDIQNGILGIIFFLFVLITLSAIIHRAWGHAIAYSILTLLYSPVLLLLKQY